MKTVVEKTQLWKTSAITHCMPPKEINACIISYFLDVLQLSFSYQDTEG